MDMSTAVEQNGNKDGTFRPEENSKEGKKSIEMLSLIQHDKLVQQGNDDTTSQDSLLQIKTVPSQSMEKIDNLLYKLGQLNPEWKAVLDKIISKVDDNQVNDYASASIELGNRDGNGPVLDDEVPRNLVKTPESSL
jgi:hypothetical protein